MAKQADTHPITGAPVELPEKEPKKIEAAIERALNKSESLIKLDAADGDCDLEPSIGGETRDDREADAGDEVEAGADDDLGCEDAWYPGGPVL
jgi:hypothetical protein